MEHQPLYDAVETVHDGDVKQRLLAIGVLQTHVDSHTLGRDELNALTYDGDRERVSSSFLRREALTPKLWSRRENPFRSSPN